MLSNFFDFIGDVFGGSDGKFSFSDLLYTDNKLDPAKIGGIAALFTSPAGLGLGGSFFGRPSQPVGYQGSIPNYRVVRDRVQGTYDPKRRPGSSGQRYFTDTRFVDLDETDPNKQTPLSQVQLNAAEQAYGLANLNRANPAREEIEDKMAIPSLTAPKVTLPASSVASLEPVPTYTMASEFPAPVLEGGIQTMATGGAVQEQARRDADALGITLDEYYAMPFKERLGLAIKDIKEIADPSLEDAQGLGILSLPKPPPERPMMPPGKLPAARTDEKFKGYYQKPPEAGAKYKIAPVPMPKFKRNPDAMNFGRAATMPKFEPNPDAMNFGRAAPMPKFEPNPDGLYVSDELLRQLLQILGIPLGPNVYKNVSKKDNEENKKNKRGDRRLQKATGGLTTLKRGKYLDGATDGMADKVPAMIDGEGPAALSDGEYVITADVVSHLGNGNSDAGAKVLDDFMGDVRMARTNTKKQAPEINPQKFLPRV